MHLSSRPIKRQKEQVEKAMMLFLTHSLDFGNVTENHLVLVYRFRRLSYSLHSIFVCGRGDMYIHIKPRVVSSYIRKSINHIFFRISFHCIKLKLQINIDGERERGRRRRRPSTPFTSVLVQQSFFSFFSSSFYSYEGKNTWQINEVQLLSTSERRQKGRRKS